MNNLIGFINKPTRTHRKPVLLYALLIFCIFNGFPQISPGQQGEQNGFGFTNIKAAAEQLADQSYTPPGKTGAAISS